ncbi:MAG TPA: HAD hydrolase-like protein [Solirubrobacteraceae bacterium]|nr:HAD hydrolase-like protein [Solirubrobacteraceae bacterium]
MSLRPSAVLFDLDGCLVDSRRAITTSTNATLKALGLPERAPEELYRYIGPPTHEAFEDMVGPELVDRAVELYRARAREHAAGESEVFEGIPAAMEELRRAGIPLSVATSKPEPLAVPLLEALELAPYFDAITGSRIDARNEPKRETLGRALDLLPALAEGDGPRVLVGDRRHDVEAAQAHGVRSVGVLWGIGSEEELRTAGADVLVAAPADLPPLLLG